MLKTVADDDGDSGQVVVPFDSVGFAGLDPWRDDGRVLCASVMARASGILSSVVGGYQAIWRCLPSEHGQKHNGHSIFPSVRMVAKELTWLRPA